LFHGGKNTALAGPTPRNHPGRAWLRADIVGKNYAFCRRKLREVSKKAAQPTFFQSAKDNAGAAA
jgi:hypothetical protein